MRVGIGYDVHRLVPGRPLVLGGVTIPYEKGLVGHSDGDVLVHAVADAFLGAVNLGDIGTHFPSNDSCWKNTLIYSNLPVFKENIAVTCGVTGYFV